jgi:hypothetical protein
MLESENIFFEIIRICRNCRVVNVEVDLKGVLTNTLKIKLVWKHELREFGIGIV